MEVSFSLNATDTTSTTSGTQIYQQAFIDQCEQRMARFYPDIRNKLQRYQI